MGANFPVSRFCDYLWPGATPYAGSPPTAPGPCAAAKLKGGTSPVLKRHRKEFVQVTNVGHAGFRIETQAGSILCDPWVNPAYFASWFPFPDNSDLDWVRLGDCDYLYVSHLHKDHFDARLLAEHVNKDAVCCYRTIRCPT